MQAVPHAPGVAILMSIRQQFADAILSGAKTIELRRRRPGFPVGTRVLIYVPAPEQIVRGIFRFDGLIAGSPAELWDRAGYRAQVSQSAFDAYYRGRAHAYGLIVAEAQRLAPVSIGIRAPQSYQWLRSENPEHALLLTHAGLTELH